MNEQIRKDKLYLDFAERLSKESTCLKRRYGCVIVKDGNIVSVGYNHSPIGEISCKERGMCPRMDKLSNSGDYSDCHSVHAEMAAISWASGKDLDGASLYLWGEEWTREPYTGCMAWRELRHTVPCPICSRMIRDAGIERLVTNA